MFILNIKKVHHQIRNHIRYQVGPKPKKVKQGKNPRKINSRKTAYFFKKFWMENFLSLRTKNFSKMTEF